MSYAMLSDDLVTRLERMRLDRGTRMLLIEMMSYCSRNLTDGLIDIPLVRISDHPDLQSGLEALQAVGLVEVHDQGYWLPEFLDHNYSRDRVQRMKAAAAKRKADYVERQELHKTGDHSKCTKNCPAVKQSENAVPNAIQNSSLSSPLLSDPQREEREERDRADTPQRASGAPAASAQSNDVHVFVDRKMTGVCVVCGMPKSNNLHQQKMPDEVTEYASELAHYGFACTADHEYDSWDLETKSGAVTMNAVASGTRTEMYQINTISLAIELTWDWETVSKDAFDAWIAGFNSTVSQLVRQNVEAEHEYGDWAGKTYYVSIKSKDRDAFHAFQCKSLIDLANEIAAGRCKP
jgi:hypothetical protein